MTVAMRPSPQPPFTAVVESPARKKAGFLAREESLALGAAPVNVAAESRSRDNIMCVCCMFVSV